MSINSNNHKKTFISAFIISLCVFLSRITGLVRDIFFASYLGNGIVSDAFYASFRLPNTFRRIFGEGALSNAFIPFFVSKVKNNKNIANNFSYQVLKILFIFLIIITIFMEIFMPEIIKVINPGFVNNNEKFVLSVKLSRIAFPYIIFISIASFFGSILNSIERFWQFASISVFMNVIFIFGLLFANGFFSNTGECLVWLLIATGIFQVIFLFYYCLKNSVIPKKNVKFLSKAELLQNNYDKKVFLKKFIPAIISSGILQINIFVDGIFASFFSGAVSYLYYTDRIGQFPLSIIGYSISVAILPSLSMAFKEKNIVNIKNIQIKSLYISSFFSFPAMFLICIFSLPIIQLVYQHGSFTYQDAKVVSLMLSVYAISIPFNVFYKILFSCFYAQNDTKTPMTISIISLIFNIISNIILIKVIGMYCVVVSTTLSSIIVFFISYYILYIRKMLFIKVSDFDMFFRILVLSILTCFVLPIIANHILSINRIFIMFLCGFIYILVCFFAKILSINLIKDIFNK